MEHFRKLEQIYYAGPFNGLLEQKITVDQDRCEIVHQVDPRFFHAGNALHGAMYFKLLDDAAYFACASREKEFFIVTMNFKLDLIRPVEGGSLRAEGLCHGEEDGRFKGSSVIYNEQGKIVAKGQGDFVRSRKRISEL